MPYFTQMLPRKSSAKLEDIATTPSNIVAPLKTHTYDILTNTLSASDNYWVAHGGYQQASARGLALSVEGACEARRVTGVMAT
jgi:hypothetical protein